MRIALVADTHLPGFGRALPGALVHGIAAADVDRILHALRHRPRADALGAPARAVRSA